MYVEDVPSFSRKVPNHRSKGASRSESKVTLVLWGTVRGKLTTRHMAWQKGVRFGTS